MLYPLKFIFSNFVFLTFVAFSAYGTFWMSYATIFIPGSGILAAYGNNKQELSNAVGLYLVVWFMFTVMLLYVYELMPFLSLHVIFLVFAVVPSQTDIEPPISTSVINKNLAFSLLLTALALAFILLAAAEFMKNVR